MIASQNPYLTPDRYLQMEETSNIKHEYIDGQIYAMAGASDAHVTIAGNLFTLLRNHVRGSGCRVYISDMKVRIESLNRYYYPDIIVSCDRRDLETSTYKRFPTVIIEVLFDSTEAFDRGDKFAGSFGCGSASPKPFQEIDYQQIESLREYILINTKQQRVDCLRRNEQFLWMFQSYNRREHLSFRLDSIDFEEKLELLYKDVSL